MCRPAPTKKTPRRREAGYTPVELLLVLALLGLFGGRALPDLVAARTQANEAAAIAELQAIAAAQAQFHDGDLDHNGVADYAPSLAALAAATGSPLADAASGYLFAIAAADASSFLATAVPAVPGASGTRQFSIDQSGAVDAQQGGSAADTGAIVLAAASAVNQLSLGVARDQVRYLVHSDLNDIEVLVLDADHDGELSFAEILDVDLLAVARAVQQHVHLAPGNAPTGDDAALRAILVAMQDELKAALALGAGGEPLPPPVAVSEPDDAADDFLGLVPQVSLGDAIASLHGLIDALDPRPFPIGEMVAPTQKANEGRKRTLQRRLGVVEALLAAGRTSPLAPRLRSLRTRCDANPRPPEWLAEEAGARVLQQIELALRLLPPA